MDAIMIDERITEQRANKRRHRKKCHRRKRMPLNEDQLKMLANFNANEKFWDVMKVTEIINRSKGPRMYDGGSSRLAWLSTANNTHLLLEKMLSPHCVHILCQTNSQVLSTVNARLRRLMPKIDRIRMRRILNDHIPAHKGRKCAYLISHPLERRQLYAFVTKAFDLLFRGELLDSSNMQRLCDNISATFTDLRHRGFLMLPNQILKGIRFDQISWLRGVHFQLKKSIVLNILKSFLNLLTHIFTSLFYSTFNYAGQIVHFRRDIWRRICLESFDLLRAERKLQILPSSAADRSSESVDRIHKLIFLPKKRTVRPIVILRNSKLKNKLNDICAVLRFLIRQNPSRYGWGISNIRLFAFAYRRFTLQHIRNQQKGQRMHFCTADMTNCYTSLEHQVLDKILHKIVPSESNFSVVSIQATNKLYKYRKMKTEAGFSFADAFSRITCKGSEEFTSSPSENQINGAELLQMIRQLAMQTVIREPFCALTSAAHGRQLRQRLFVSGRGIGQGSSISVALCNLYLGHVEREIYPLRPKMFCRRYMDDYLMIADQKEQIEKLLTTLVSEVPKFGLCFGRVVTSFRAQISPNQSDRVKHSLTRVKTMKPKEKIQWCGLAINHRTLSLTVDYRRYLHRRPSISFPSVTLCSSEHFHFICSTVKRALIGRMVLLRNCASVWPSKRRGSLRKDFCRFVHSHYTRHILRHFNLNSNDVFVRDFLCQLHKYVWDGFRKRSLPSQLVSSSICKGPISIFQI